MQRCYKMCDGCDGRVNKKIIASNNQNLSNAILWSRYQLVIGSLLSIMLGTRPDISFAVIKMSQFSSNPTKEHLQKVLYIVRYPSSSKELCIVYSGTGDSNDWCTYSDTDWADDIETSCSTTGYAICLGNGIVSWLSRRQWRVTVKAMQTPCGNSGNSRVGRSWLGLALSLYAMPLLLIGSQRSRADRSNLEMLVMSTSSR